MHPSVRLLSLERCSLHSSRLLYASTTCRRQVAPRSFPVRQIRYNSDDTSLTERIRRKIWGTDSPPGLKDPYGGKGVFEERWGGQRQPSQEAEPIEQESDIAPPDAYTEATNWEGLERIGHLGKWTDLNKNNPADQYHPWTRSRKHRVSQLKSAAHQTAVELCLLHRVQKPLTSTSEHTPRYPSRKSKMLMECRIKFNTNWGEAIVFPNMRTQYTLLHAFAHGVPHGVPRPGYNTVNSDQTLQRAGVNLDDPQTSSRDKQMQLEHEKASSAGGFTKLEFSDPEIKFAFVKRFTQLTHFYLPDSFISEMKRVNDLLKYAITETTRISPKIAAQLDARRSLRKLPNVKIHDRRQTRGDVDASVGRQKIIKAELERRGLIENTL